MSETNFVPYLISDRTSTFLHLIDALQFTESELIDMYLGLCYRLKHSIDFNEQPVYQAVQNAIQGLQQIESDIEQISAVEQGAIDDQ